MRAPIHFLTLLALAVAIGTAGADDGKEEALVLTDLEGTVHRPFADEEKNSRAAVFVFVSTDCPIANTYQPVLRRLATRFGKQQVPFFLVHCDPDVTTEAARRHARDFGITSPVVLDREQALVRRLTAKITPEAFVVTPDGKTAYRGRIDDRYLTWGKKRPEPTRNDLVLALEAVLAGKDVAVPRTDAVGCEIFVD